MSFGFPTDWFVTRYMSLANGGGWCELADSIVNGKQPSINLVLSLTDHAESLSDMTSVSFSLTVEFVKNGSSYFPVPATNCETYWSWLGIRSEQQWIRVLCSLVNFVDLPRPRLITSATMCVRHIQRIIERAKTIHSASKIQGKTPGKKMSVTFNPGVPYNLDPSICKTEEKKGKFCKNATSIP